MGPVGVRRRGPITGSGTGCDRTTEAFSITTSEVVLCKHPSNYSFNRLSYSLNHLTFSLNRLSGSVNDLSYSLNHLSGSMKRLSGSANSLSG